MLRYRRRRSWIPPRIFSRKKTTKNRNSHPRPDEDVHVQAVQPSRRKITQTYQKPYREIPTPQFVKRLTEKHFVLIPVVVLVLTALFLNGFLQSSLGIAVLFFIGIMSTYYKRALEGFAAVGFEFVTVTSMLAGVAFGPLVGLLFGFATSTASVVISRDIGPTTGFFLLSSALVGAAAQPLSGSVSIVALGMMAVAFSTALVQFFTLFVQTDIELKAAVIGGIFTNSIMNYLLLIYLARPLLSLAGA